MAYHHFCVTLSSLTLTLAFLLHFSPTIYSNAAELFQDETRKSIVSEKSLPLRPPVRNDRGHIEYKTTYACDGNVLSLSCRPNESIHLVRANYGRFSLSICNDGGKLDLRVNCMSFRSYLNMQDRCSGKSKCNATVSSNLFGDPCPGTPKYLEVQYHCVPNLAPTSSSSSPSSSVSSLPSSVSSSSLPSLLPITSTTRRPPLDAALPIDARILRPSTKLIDRQIESSTTSYYAPSPLPPLQPPPLPPPPPPPYSNNNKNDDGFSETHMIPKATNDYHKPQVYHNTYPSSISNVGDVLSTQNKPSTQPTTIVFRHLHEDNVFSPKCVYWSPKASDWLSDGCSVASTNITHTICQCDHMSSFALLMEVRSPSSADDVDERLSKLQSFSSSQALIINSRVIGETIDHDSLSPSSIVNFADFPSSHNTPLPQPITIVFRHLHEENVFSPRCVYWSPKVSDWSTDGCSVATTNLTHTVCQCDHLSSFALLMEVHLPPSSSSSSSSTFNLDDDESIPINWLRLVVIIASGISALCLLFILMILYTIHGDNREVLSIHKDLCLTLLIVQVTFFIGIFQTDNLLPCILSAGILHYFLLSSFLWTFLESFDHFLNLIEVFETIKTTNRIWWYYYLAFGGPGLVTLLSLFINPHSYGSANYCWIRIDITLWLTLVGPCVLALIASFVFICISGFIVCHNSAISTALKGKEQLKVEDIRCGLKWITFLLLFQCINWITCYAYLTNQTSIPLGLTFACFNCLLGFYCIIFCIIRTDSVQHHKIAQHLPLMDWCFDGSETVTSTKESVFVGSTHNGLNHNHHHHHHTHSSSLYGPSPVIPVVTHVTTQVSPYSDGTIRTFKTSHIINNTLALYESIESPPPPLATSSSSTSSTNNSGSNTLNNLQQLNNRPQNHHNNHIVNNIPATSTVVTLMGNTNGTTTFLSMSPSSSSSSTGGIAGGNQQKQHHQQQIQQQHLQQLQQNQLISSQQHHHNNMSLGVYGQSTMPHTNNLNLNNSKMIIGGGLGSNRNHSSLMLNQSLGLYESIEPPSPESSPTPYHHTSRNQIYLGHGSLSQQHHQQQHLIGTTSGRKHRMLIPSDFPV